MGRKYVKAFVFEKRNWSLLTQSDTSKAKLNMETNQLELVPQSYDINGDPIYPLDTDLTITTWLTSPEALLQWIGFSMQPMTQEQPAGTSVGFKLNDGTDDWWWNAGAGPAAWEVAGATDWSTEAEIAANISTFPATAQQIAVVINLVTTDEYATPTVKGVCFLMDAALDYIKSIVGDSLVPALRDGIQPTIDFAINAPGGVQLNLRDLETPYDVLDVTAAYNHTQDTDHLTDLLSSYDSASKTITLSSAIDRGEVAWLRLVVQPKVYVNWASQDYVEVERIPAVVINSISGSGNVVAGVAFVTNTNDLTATVLRFPFRLSLEFEVLLLAKDNRTLFGMQEGALSFVSDNQLLHWRAVDEQISLTPMIGQEFTPRPNLSDKHQGSFAFRLDDIHLWLTEAETSVPLVQTLNFNLVHTSNGLRYGQLQAGVRTEP